ncbi:hypothetical protein [Vogesella indigofera]|uniref:hypothetical protein n=1 Tax=Vogesella indigofera TaxID=45465 RepID=UPI00234E4640|nr:hypothetical protein [Vogesella indigofera]MDC7696322.1 hypothetical protein [Vogesella indigofera]
MSEEDKDATSSGENIFWKIAMFLVAAMFVLNVLAFLKLVVEGGVSYAVDTHPAGAITTGIALFFAWMFYIPKGKDIEKNLMGKAFYIVIAIGIFIVFSSLRSCASNDSLGGGQETPPVEYYRQ